MKYHIDTMINDSYGNDSDGIYVKNDRQKRSESELIEILSERYEYYPRLDSSGSDMYHRPSDDLLFMFLTAESDPKCKGFNTNGWFKSSVNTDQLEVVDWFTEKNGIYVKK